MENKNTNTIVGNRMKQMRLELHLTQDELAQKVGVGGKSTIATYESGRNTPADDVKIKLCELFNCSMDYLMGISDERKPVKYDKELIAFYNGYKDMNTADKEALDNVFNLIVEKNKNKKKGD